MSYNASEYYRTFAEQDAAEREEEQERIETEREERARHTAAEMAFEETLNCEMACSEHAAHTAVCQALNGNPVEEALNGWLRSYKVASAIGSIEIAMPALMSLANCADAAGDKKALAAADEMWTRLFDLRNTLREVA